MIAALSVQFTYQIFFRLVLAIIIDKEAYNFERLKSLYCRPIEKKLVYFSVSPIAPTC